jgi:hypothetical protein
MSNGFHFSCVSFDVYTSGHNVIIICLKAVQKMGLFVKPRAVGEASANAQNKITNAVDLFVIAPCRADVFQLETSR